MVFCADVMFFLFYAVRVWGCNHFLSFYANRVLFFELVLSPLLLNSAVLFLVLIVVIHVIQCKYFLMYFFVCVSVKWKYLYAYIVVVLLSVSLDMIVLWVM